MEKKLPSLVMVALAIALLGAPADAGKISRAAPCLINLDFNGQYRPESPQSAYAGPLATGAANDVWNSVGQSGWPLKPHNLDNTRTSFVYADGSPVPGLTVRVQNLGQYWTHTAAPNHKPGFTAQAMIDFIYSDYGEGVVTLTRVPAGRYDVLVYGCGGSSRPPTYILRKNGVSLGTKGVGDSPTACAQTTWQEDVQYVVFRGVEVNEDDRLELRSVEEKRVLSAVQLVPRP
jgi:hypothetical protein